MYTDRRTGIENPNGRQGPDTRTPSGRWPFGDRASIDTLELGAHISPVILSVNYDALTILEGREFVKHTKIDY